MRIFNERPTWAGLRRELHLLLTTKPPTPGEYLAMTLIVIVVAVSTIWLIGSLT